VKLNLGAVILRFKGKFAEIGAKSECTDKGRVVCHSSN